MPINDLHSNGESVNVNNGTQNSAANNESYAAGNVNTSLGFLPGDIKLMSANKASDYTIAVGERITKAFTGPQYADFRVYMLDKEVDQSLAYSYIVIAKSTEKSVYYFVVVLEATGRAPLSAEEIITEFNTSIKNRTVSNKIWTTDDAVNSTLRNKIAALLDRDFRATDKKDRTIIAADGIIIPYTNEDVDVAARNAAAIACNALNVMGVFENPSNKDLNIAKGARETKNAVLQIESSISRTTSRDELDNPIRSDWKIDLAVRQENQAYDNLSYIDDLNRENQSCVLTKACGFIDAIADEKITPIAGGVPLREIRMSPHIIITDIFASKPTMGFMLFGLISTLVMGNKNMWLAAFLPDGSKYNVGALNIKTNIEKNQNGIGNKIDFNAERGKNKLTQEQIYTIINDMFSLAPIVSMDIPAYGPHSYYSSVLSSAASGSVTPNSDGAINALIETAHSLTNGAFDKNFPKDSIFSYEGVVVPMGTWMDKNGQLRDIRDVDLTMIASETESIELMDEWIMSNLPSRLTSKDPYLTKVNIINQLIPKAKITGKAIRVTFTKLFISHLEEAAVKAGLRVKYDSEAKVVESNNLGVVTSAYANARRDGNARFAYENVFSGPTYNTNWISSGTRF